MKACALDFHNRILAKRKKTKNLKNPKIDPLRPWEP